MSFGRSCVVALVAAWCFACSGSSSSSSGGGGGGGVSGTVAGKSFASVSGFGRMNKDGSVAIVLSDAEGICESLKTQKIHAGETVVQLYDLSGKAPGAFTSLHNDVKYASVSSECKAGQAVDGSVAKASRGSSVDVSITSLTDTKVEGKLTVGFADGSNVSGSFSLGMCPMNDAEGVTCQ